MRVDELCTWLFDGGAAARTLLTARALAWFAVIPAFAWIYVQVETPFYRVFRGYFGGIESDVRSSAIVITETSAS